MPFERVRGELVEVPEKEVARRQEYAKKAVRDYAKDLGIDKSPEKSVSQMLAEINAKLGR